MKTLRPIELCRARSVSDGSGQPSLTLRALLILTRPFALAAPWRKAVDYLRSGNMMWPGRLRRNGKESRGRYSPVNAARGAVGRRRNTARLEPRPLPALRHCSRLRGIACAPARRRPLVRRIAGRHHARIRVYLLDDIPGP